MFRPIVKRLVASFLRLEARLVLKKYRPKILAITGSVGKTGTKAAIAAVLGEKFRVRASEKSFNSELGVPLTILGCPNAWWSLTGWVKNFLEGLGLILFRSPYPEWLVLEIGVDRPGDMKRMLEWLPVNIAVVTSLPHVPAHVEFFKSPEQVVEEKWLLASTMRDQGLVILNYDDEKIRALGTELRCPILTYGFNTSAEVRGSNVHITYADQEKDQPIGLGLKVDYHGSNVPLERFGVLGEHQLYALLAAVAVGVALDINLIKSGAILAKLTAPPGRMRLLPGVKQTLIIDDTYNSSPAALEAALQTLSDLRLAGRKIAVLGDMLELGRHTIEAHRAVGIQAARVAHVLVTVGLRMKFAIEEAARKKMGKKVLHHFDDSRTAGQFLQNFIEAGDIILVKGSQSLRMERVVEEIMAEPGEKKKLLVRQEKEWQGK